MALVLAIACGCTNGPKKTLKVLKNDSTATSVKDDALGAEFSIQKGWDGDASINVPVLKVDPGKVDDFCKKYGIKESSLPMKIPTNNKSASSLLLTKVGTTDVPFLVILMEDGSVRTVRLDQFVSGQVPESVPLLGFDNVADFRKATRKVISKGDTLAYQYVVAIGKNGSNKEIPINQGDRKIYYKDGGNLITIHLDPSWKMTYSVASFDGTLSSDSAEGIYITETLNPEKVTYQLSDGRKGEFLLKWKGISTDGSHAMNYEVVPKEGLLLGSKQFGQGVMYSDTK